jgi:pyruvate ferredoxin oxidoreductase alpha subunit
MEIKRQQFEAMRNARRVIAEVSADFTARTGREYAMFEAYRMDDAEFAVLLMSSSAGTGKVAADALRERGVKAGLVKLRVFRPFPAEELAHALAGLKALGIMDKSDSFSGCGGPLGAEVRAALYGKADGIRTVNYVYGLGGRDVRVEDFEEIFDELARAASGAETPDCRYCGVRGE